MRLIFQVNLLLISLIFLTSCSKDNSEADSTQVLIFSKTMGFRHGSISEGVAAIQALGSKNGFLVDHTEDASQFNDSTLGQYQVIVWMSTTGDVLGPAEQESFERYIQAGGGYVGVHSATDTEYSWPWYGGLLGGDAWFLNHPAIQPAMLNIVNATHPSTRHYPPVFTITDEWYNFRNNPVEVVNVLMTIDESSYEPGAGAMGNSHPIAWFHEYDGGRAWYTALGHRPDLYSDPGFKTHLLGGITWAAQGR